MSKPSAHELWTGQELFYFGKAKISMREHGIPICRNNEHLGFMPQGLWDLMFLLREPRPVACSYYGRVGPAGEWQPCLKVCIDDDGVLLFCLQGEVGERGLAGHPGEKVSLLLFLFTQFILLINESASYITS